MVAGSYVGRIGGLAVALGIGAAVFVGQGVASAEPSSTSGSESSSSTDSGGTKPAAEPAPKKKKPTHEASSRKTGTATTRTVRSDATESTKKADEPKPEKDPAPTASVTVSSTTAKTADVQPPARSTATNPQAPFAENSPTAPVGSPLPWMMMAAARQELGRTPSLNRAANAVTTSGDANPVDAKSVDAKPVDSGPVEANTLAAADAPPAVVAIPQTSLLQPLQLLPVVGPLFVTPIVAVIHQIPLIGDVLHPLIGYPLGLTGGSTPRDYKVISSDGTAIYVHFFPAQGSALGMPAPTILNGPGLGLPGETNPTAVANPFLAHQVIGMAPLLTNGYNVVTWDPRGEWNSGGRLEIDNPEFEGQDMKAIISWLETQPEVELVHGDPKIGMVGASYGGGIQLVTAAIDPRVDAIVPTIAWNNLNTSLYKSEAPKTSWGALLTAALIFTGARVNPQTYSAVATALLTGSLPQTDQDFLDDRSPFGLLQHITAPTLLIQGTVDTLFTLAGADANAKALIAQGVPTKVVWYCGGHGGCITSTNDGDVIERATLDWLDRYVKNDLSVKTGPQFEWVDQHGQNFSSKVYPVPTGTALTASSEEGGTLPLLLLFGGSGPNLRAFEGGLINGLLGILSGAKATNAVQVTLPAQPTTTYIVGAPQLEFNYSGTGSSTHIYAQLVDDTTGLVLGNQVTPIPVTLDGETHTAKIPLEMVAHTLAPGETVTLQLVASAVEYQALWSSGTLNVSHIKVSLPTVAASEMASLSAAQQVA